MNELNLWVGEIMNIVYPGWLENRESILFLDPDNMTYEKTPMGAAMRSLAVPGLGQAYSGKKLSAAFWVALESSLSVGILLSFLNYDAAAKNFLQYQNDYSNTDDEKEIAQYRELAISEHAKHIRYNNLLQQYIYPHLKYLQNRQCFGRCSLVSVSYTHLTLPTKRIV